MPGGSGRPEAGFREEAGLFAVQGRCDGMPERAFFLVMYSE
jgi:hypothetical protein